MSVHLQPRRRRLTTLLVALAVVVAACADDGDRGSDVSSSSEQVDAAIDGPTNAAADETGARGGGDDGGDDDGGDDGGDGVDPMEDADFGFDEDSTVQGFQPTDPTQPSERNALTAALFVGLEIIFTGEVVLEAPDVDQTTDDVIDAVFANGGAIWGLDTRSDPTPRSVLTVRVPPEFFPDVMEALKNFDGIAGVGVVSESVTTDDVTEVVVDLDARIIAAESSVQRVQELLDDATDLNRIFELEGELVSRQADLERLLGQRKTIGDRVDLSTITVTVVEADPDRLEADMEIVAWLGESTDLACPGSTDISIGANEAAVLCVSISNTGEDVLTDIDITAPRFRLRVNDFSALPGNTGIDSIAPGDDLIVTATLDAEDGFIHRVDASDGLQIAVDVTATPATTEGAELVRNDSVFISTDVDDPLPGFGDAFSDGWGAMTFIVSLLMIALGVVLPFLLFVPIVWWIGRKLTGASRRRAEERAAFVRAYNASQNPTAD